MVAVAVVLAVLVGVSLGLLGGGGSILAVPLLVYVAGIETKEAIATSLLIVGVTSAVAVLPHARAGRVRWRTGLVFGAAGMVGAYGGGRLAAHVPATALLAAFAVMMLVTATAMIRGRRVVEPSSPHAELRVGHVVAEGVAVGLVTGLIGAGGGFLVVPALVLLGGLPMPVAVGTSLVVIAMKSFAGLTGYLAAVEVDWSLASAVTAAALVGTVLGARWSAAVGEDVLRKAFGWFVVAMGGFVLAQQLPASLLPRTVVDALLWTLAATAVAALSWRLVAGVGAARPRLRQRPPDATAHPRPPR